MKLASMAITILLTAAIGAADRSARAAEGPWLDQEPTRVRLIAGQDAVGVDGRLSLGLQIAIDEGWKIYWRSPGDAGFPPSMDWSLSANLGDVSVDWPAPKRFTFYGLETFGYENEVVLPIVATAAEPSRPVHVRVMLKLAVCKDICLFQEGRVTLSLPAGEAAPSVHASTLARYQAKVPVTGAIPGLALESLRVEGTGRNRTLALLARSQTPFQAPDVIVEAPERLLFGRPDVTFEQDRRRARFHIPVDTGPRQPSLAGMALTITLIDGARAVEQTLIARPEG